MAFETVGYKLAEFKTTPSVGASYISRFRIFMPATNYNLLAGQIDLSDTTTVQCCLPAFSSYITGRGAEELQHTNGNDWYLFEGEYAGGYRTGLGRMSYPDQAIAFWSNSAGTWHGKYMYAATAGSSCVMKIY